MNSHGSYEGLRSELYDLLWDNEQLGDEEFYRHIIECNSGCALEVGSGTGRLILPYLKLGLEIEGVDCSASMLNICHQKALRDGLSINLYQQKMQELNLPRRFRTIYIPFFSFQSLYNYEEALEALKRFYIHLESNGQLIISIYVYCHLTQTNTYKKNWRIQKTGIRPSDGATFSCYRDEKYNFIEQVVTCYYRYIIYQNLQEVTKEYYVCKKRCYDKDEFLLMLRRVGFKEISVYADYSNREIIDESKVMIFVANK